MKATGGVKLIRRPDKYAFDKRHNKRPSSRDQNRDVYEPLASSQKRLRMGGVFAVYK